MSKPTAAVTPSTERKQHTALHCSVTKSEQAKACFHECGCCSANKSVCTVATSVATNGSANAAPTATATYNIHTHTCSHMHTRACARTCARTISIALVGNPNSGKTTLFNSLTGSTLRTGNRAGVTVETKIGKARNNSNVTIADTPGIYDIAPYSPEEIETAKFLAENKPDVIINVVDCTCLSRSLALTLKLAKLGVPIIVALNMAKEAARSGLAVDAEKLSQKVGLTCMFVSAADKDDCLRLLSACIDLADKPSSTRTDKSAQQTDDETYIAAAEIAKQCTTATATSKKSPTERIDDIVLNRWLALPLFAVAMWLTFWISVQGPGRWLSLPLTDWLTPLMKNAATAFLAQTNCEWLVSLVADGVVGGIMSVVGFTPQVALITACMALMEESGYLARVAFVTDRLLRPLGLGGKSVVCLTIGCGCSVPAILSARTITCPQQRRATVGLVPFVPCSAKTAVIGYFSATFFEGNALIALSLYLATAVAVFVGGLILRALSKKTDDEEPFAVELPQYRKPLAKCVWRQTTNAAKTFLTKAGTTIFVTSIVLWALQRFDFTLRPSNTANGMLAQIGRFLSPLFAPLGFDDGGCGEIYSVAALSGLSAKETILTTLAVLGNGNVPNITPVGAYCFVLYNLLTVPCIATVSTSVAEQGAKGAILSLSLQAVLAYVATALLHFILTMR